MLKVNALSPSVRFLIAIMKRKLCEITLATAIMVMSALSPYMKIAVIDSLRVITSMLSLRILFELPRERSIAIYTLLKKLSTVANSVTTKYFEPTAMNSSGVPVILKNAGVIGARHRTAREIMPQIAIRVLNLFFTIW